jgi:hypothetical protein
MALAKNAYGPVEDYDQQWRNTNTHTRDEMEEVYCEVFFGGFTPHDGRAFPDELVKKFFIDHGTVDFFQFDAETGTGSVSYTAGLSGEQCYMCNNLTPLPNGNVLYLEFAMFLPFVNTLLSVPDLGRDMTRQMLRTMPRIRHYTRCFAKDATVIDLWKKAYCIAVERSRCTSGSETLLEQASIPTHRRMLDGDEALEFRCTLNYILFKSPATPPSVFEMTENALRRGGGSFAGVLNLLEHSPLDYVCEYATDEELREMKSARGVAKALLPLLLPPLKMMAGCVVFILLLVAVIGRVG